MSTTLKNSRKATAKKNASKEPTTVIRAIIEGEQKNIFTAEIDFSPFNYRRYFSEKALQEFAIELALHGIISPITVRPMPSGRYELVTGERRLRAAQIAGLTEIPAVIKVLTDEQVIEIQLAENLQREDPHPMHEAQGIGQMQKTRKTIDEIAARLGKSKAFVFNRIKLLSLIEPFQDMFMANAINLLEATEIAGLSAESQLEFYERKCADWREQESFELDDIKWLLRSYKDDLKNAPFNTEDETLIPEMGACTNCPSNSATLETLFPELAKKAICSNTQCYQRKCNAHLAIAIGNAFLSHKPQAFLFNNQAPETIMEALKSIPEASEIPSFNRYDVTIYQVPTMPDKEDYMEQNDDWNEMEDEEDRENFENDESAEPIFDTAGYEVAMNEYQSDLENYQSLLEEGHIRKALYFTGNKIDEVVFSDSPQQATVTSTTVTAKEVQEAIKAGMATPELLQAEIGRINNREQRAKELDREKVQLNVHDVFSQQISEVGNNSLTSDDLAAARLLIYHSLNYSVLRTVSATLVPPKTEDGISEAEHLYRVMSNLTEHEFSYLIRTAIASQSDSKNPRYETGYFLYKTAEGAGVDVDAIEAKHLLKVKDREDKQTIRIKELEMKINRLQKTQK